jgi:GNAT superfamily N-acetyltransferase
MQTAPTPLLRNADTDAELLACFPVMQELRPHLTNAADFIAQVRRQASQDYRILAAWQDNTVIGLAGYRLQENLIYGRFLYVDDLVTAKVSRGGGVGAALLAALRVHGAELGCARLVLDTALSNALGQRFYFRNGLLSAGLHFGQALA